MELPDGDPTKELLYKDFKKYLKSVIKLAKSSYYTNKFEKYKGNSKKTWEVINELRGKVDAWRTEKNVKRKTNKVR